MVLEELFHKAFYMLILERGVWLRTCERNRQCHLHDKYFGQVYLRLRILVNLTRFQRLWWSDGLQWSNFLVSTLCCNRLPNLSICSSQFHEAAHYMASTSFQKYNWSHSCIPQQKTIAALDCIHLRYFCSSNVQQICDGFNLFQHWQRSLFTFAYLCIQCEWIFLGTCWDFWDPGGCWKSH